MSSSTVFGHLALQFTTHPENLATEALAFVLRTSPSASSAFASFLRSAGIDCPDNLQFETQQAGAEQSIPDMKCFDSEGRLRVIVENKFWAGLTDNQPVTYIRELANANTGLALFIVPEARLSLLWHELMTRCLQANIPVGTVQAHRTITVANLSTSHHLAITSWKRLLAALATSTASASDVAAHSNIAQLQGLCDAMDEQAFLPLRGDELTNLEMARRIINFSDLPLEIIAKAEALGFCNRKGLKETFQRYCPGGTYVRIGPHAPWFGFDAKSWLKLGVSPLWVNFFPPPYTRTAEVREKLVRYRTTNPPRCFDFEGRVAVPVTLAAGVEKAYIVDDAVRQIGELATELGEVSVLASSTSAT